MAICGSMFFSLGNLGCFLGGCCRIGFAVLAGCFVVRFVRFSGLGFRLDWWSLQVRRF